MSNVNYVSIMCCDSPLWTYTEKLLSPTSTETTRLCENCGSTDVSTLSWSYVEDGQACTHTVLEPQED